MLLKNHIQDFLTLKPVLQSFLFRLLTNRQDTEDIIQETYMKIHQHIDSFKGESSFKTWVFAIALNLAKNHISRQKRWLENAQDYGANLHAESEPHWEKMKKVFDQTPDKIYEIKEHIAYCFNCISKTLVTNQQVCLLLKEVYDFKIQEIIQITGLTEGIVKHAIADARKNMMRIFDNRCSFVSKKGVCHQCTVLKGNFNTKHEAEIDAVKIKMVKDGANPDKQHLLNLRIELVRNIDPLNSPNTILNTYMLENNERWVAEAREKGLLSENEDAVVRGQEF